jgi:hypothetical protein
MQDAFKRASLKHRLEKLFGWNPIALRLSEHFFPMASKGYGLSYFQ